MTNTLHIPDVYTPTWDCPISDINLRNIVASGCGPGFHELTVFDNAAVPRVKLPSTDTVALLSTGLDMSETRAAVLLRGQSVATVVIKADSSAEERAVQSARSIAAHLADAWESTQEIDSLSGEIVHVYEELHLLYDLGEALTGQLTVSQTAEVIMAKSVNTLRAAWGELQLLTSTGQEMYAYPPQFSRRREAWQTDTAHRLHTEIRSSGNLVGRISLVRPADTSPFSSSDIKLLDAVGAFSGSAIRNAQLYQEMRRLADTDALTGLANHRAVQEALDAELAQSASQSRPLGIILIDLDDFKLFNDTYGHLIGDQILRSVSVTLTDAIRSQRDVAGRYGGDEFVMVLPGADRAGTEAVARRILETTRKKGVKIDGEETVPLSISLGCAVFPDDALLKNDLLSHADAALYEVKRHGGNAALIGKEDGNIIHSAPSPSTTFGALQGLVNAVDAKDRYTRDHSETVTEYALLLAQQMGLSSEVCSALRVAGLLHDIGKIGIPDQILRKPGRLNDDEYRIMQQHVNLSEMIIKEVPHLVDVISAVSSHHERYDGGGYPRGLAGESIPLMGRIMALADACSAMLLDRPYRKGLTWGAVTAELRNGKGTQFDPGLVEPFITAMEESPLHRGLLKQSHS